MKKIFSLLLVAVILAFALAACNSGDVTPTTAAGETTTTTVPASTTKGASSFDEAFSMRGITYTAFPFSTPSSAAFAGLMADDSLELIEVGYDGNTITEYVKTIYLVKEGYDISSKEQIASGLENGFAESKELSNANVTSWIDGDLCIVRIELDSLDDAELLNAAIRTGSIDIFTTERSSLTLSDVTDVLTSQGFIKK